MPAVTIRRPQKIKEPTDGTTRRAPWNTLLLNCSCHSFDQVARQLTKAIRCTFDQGLAIADTVHHQGKAVVYTGHRERCEAVAMVLEAIGLLTKVVQ